MSRGTQRASFGAALIGLLAMATPVTATPVTYAFEGPTYASADFPYTTEMKVTGYITLSNPGRSDVLSSFYSPIIDWAFFDGVRSYNNFNSINHNMQLKWDENGSIVEWYISISERVSAIESIALNLQMRPSPENAFRYEVFSYSWQTYTGTRLAQVLGTGPIGQWTTLPANPPLENSVPVPAALPLMLSALAGLGLVARLGAIRVRPRGPKSL